VNLRNSKGMNLAELMVAIVILLLCVLLHIGMFSVGTIRIRQARALATASFLAKEKMEETLTESEIIDSQGSFTLPFTEYSYTVRKKDYVETPALEQIEVTVTAPPSLGGKKVKLVMLRAL
jgi:prepilin-type N-terminal cleavage/methylation domain-containing protein